MSLTLSRTDLIRSANFINGAWAANTSARLDVTNPATGVVIASVPDSGAPEALAALDAAHAAFPTWRKVPAKQRAAVVLRYYEDLPDAEIAVILDCSPATVRSQIHRALSSLRTTIGTEEVKG